MVDVIIIGGGLAGLVNSILLSRAGLKVDLLEKNTYPFHRVCGEYISKEVIPFLEKHDIYPHTLEPSHINELQISSIKGNSFVQPLDLGGFGISRHAYDHWLCGVARDSGVQVFEQTQVIDLKFVDDHFHITSNAGEEYISKIVIGAYGKRAKLDQTLNRTFLKKRSPYVGVKYHALTDLPSNRISLHNFEGGYCGINRIEEEKYNICYLTKRDQIRTHGNIDVFQKEVMMKNPFLKKLFETSTMLFDKPEVINEITFDKQEPVANHVLMCGDAAGMITPLCGNGMAMAIHSAKLLSELIIRKWDDGRFDRQQLENEYAQIWRQQFGIRLWAGRKIQHLFGNGATSELAVMIGKGVKPVSNFLIKQTHGQPFR
jgi:menaquinone-9 beta-reductase